MLKNEHWALSRNKTPSQLSCLQMPGAYHPNRKVWPFRGGHLHIHLPFATARHLVTVSSTETLFMHESSDKLKHFPKTKIICSLSNSAGLHLLVHQYLSPDCQGFQDKLIHS